MKELIVVAMIVGLLYTIAALQLGSLPPVAGL